MSTRRQAREMVEARDKSITKFLLSLSRDNLKKMIGIVTRHNTLNYHLSKIGLSSTPICRGCSEAPETSKHLSKTED